MTKNLLYISLVWLLISCRSESSENQTEQLQESLEIFNQAFRQADVARLESMITEDYQHTNGSWKSFGREKWLGYMEKRADDIKNGKLEITNYSMADINIIVNKNSAFVTARVISEGLDNNEPFKSEFRVSNYWVLEGEVWKRAGFHDTKIESN